MRFSKDFINITLADFIVRSAYQMGKTPLLPFFAATLGATDAFLGVIVAVSTLTGLVLKPFIGILSDRWGRRVWFLVGTLVFVTIPFFYRFVSTPEQLFFIRIIHGLATAIYGPVTLAYIAELRPHSVAQSLGWFGMARSGGYIVGPALAGWLLLTLDPAAVFTIIGLLSCLALVPVLLLKEVQVPPRDRPPLRQQVTTALAIGSRIPSIWLAGALEASSFVALYTVKAFLPVYALAAGTNVALVGLFFSVQEGAHILLKPLGGRLGDRAGHLLAIISGMALLGIGLMCLPLFTGVGLMIPALITGAAQAMIFPATVALVARQTPPTQLGAGMGLIGMMNNLGKVIGPVVGGLLITQLGFQVVLYGMALGLIAGAAVLLLTVGSAQRRMLKMEHEH